MSDATPKRAGATKLPIMVSGTKSNVIAEASATRATTFSVAICTFCINAKIPTNATNGTAIAVNAITPETAFFADLPIVDNGININVIAADNIDNAMAFWIAFFVLRPDIIARIKPNAVIKTSKPPIS